MEEGDEWDVAPEHGVEGFVVALEHNNFTRQKQFSTFLVDENGADWSDFDCRAKLLD